MRVSALTQLEWVPWSRYTDRGPRAHLRVRYEPASGARTMSESSGNAVLPALDSAVERLRRLKSALGARLLAEGQEPFRMVAEQPCT